MRRIAILAAALLVPGCQLFLDNDDLVLPVGADAATLADAGAEDAGEVDASTAPDSGTDAGADSGTDAGADSGTDAGAGCNIEFQLPADAVVWPSGFLREDAVISLVPSPSTATIYYTTDGTLPSIADGDFGGLATTKVVGGTTVDLKAPTGGPNSNPWVNNPTVLTINAILVDGSTICPAQATAPAIDAVFPNNVFREGYTYEWLVGYNASAVSPDGPIDVTTKIKSSWSWQMGLALNPNNPGTIYFAEESQIRKIDPQRNLGTEVSSTAGLNKAGDIAFDGSGNLFIVDVGNNRIARWNGATLSTFAGGGTNQPVANVALSFDSTAQVALSGLGFLALTRDDAKLYMTSGNNIYVIDMNASPKRTLTWLQDFANPAKVPGIAGALSGPTGLATDADGNLLVVSLALRILKRDAQTGSISVLLEWVDPGYGWLNWGTSIGFGYDGFIYYGWQVSGADSLVRRDPVTGAQFALFQAAGNLSIGNSVMAPDGTLYVYSGASDRGGPYIAVFR